MSFTLIVPQTSIRYLVSRALALSFYEIEPQKQERAIDLFYSSIDLGTIIAVFGIWCEGRSIFFTQASILVKSLQCLVFGVKGDRS
ncbi:hypothetical protein [Microcoleus sp. S13_C5]|uniref:hypothetical protein n=1 Tax=Microcoleus sp. S13_C5 TaxID=3055411 RepID=UPI002FD53A53